MKMPLDKIRGFLFEREHNLQTMPPTEASLHEHTLRAAFEAGQIGGRAGLGHSEGDKIPSPDQWGWERAEDGKWTPLWTRLPWIWDACRDLDVCGCKTECATLRCSCRRNDLPCIRACKECHGNCNNSRYTAISKMKIQKDSPKKLSIW